MLPSSAGGERIYQTQECIRSVSYTHLDVYKRQGFVFWLAGSETVCQVTACQLRTMNGRSFRLFYPGEVSRASLARTVNDSICYA